MPFDPFRLPRLLFPAPGVDLTRFAVIACDQFTAEPSYWNRADRFVGAAPSCLRLTLPEVYLSENDGPRIAAIHHTMEDYLQRGTLRELPDGLVLIERDTGRGTPRRGVLLAFDLDAYDETPGASTPIRPTEATVTERVPARLAIRGQAPFELPHILLFLNDPSRTVLEPAFAAPHTAPLYDFELMQGGGHITGRMLPPGTALDGLLDRLSAYTAATPLAFATGDGNHSMAAAKAFWEQKKSTLSAKERRTHPARFVLAELVNLWDESICFEAVHRLLLHVDPADALRFIEGYLSARADKNGRPLRLAYRCQGVSGVLETFVAPNALPVAVLQQALDAYLHARPAASIDFIHGTDTLLGLADAAERLGFLLPDFEKDTLFPYVQQHGVLPRKTFSMGTALEKRYYLEGRAIR